MQFGIHAFVWTEGGDQRALERAMGSARDSGFDLFEFPGLDPRVVDIDRLGRHAADLGIKVGASAGLTPDLDVTSADPDVVRRGEAFLNQAVSLARDLGSRQLSGPLFSAHRKFPTMPTPQGWQTSLEIVSRVAEKGKEAGVALCLEVLNRYETNLINTVKQGVDYIRDSGSDNIFLHIDTYHMNIEEADQAQAIRYSPEHIGYFHVGENHRGYLGSGMINFAPIFDALLAVDYSKTISVEAFDSRALGDNLKAICAIWRDLWRDGDAFARHAKAFLDMQLEAAKQRAGAYAAAPAA